ncbi:MAG: tRNA pseudouridine(55) synthase TruB [Candidatus Komeilibacteria bacterium]|nr:tRNA pseudouridine(55) synthase TruB [Candidatus Komeilibacteria bacterium]
MTTENKSGFILIDKPKGWTSFDVVAKLRGITGVKKIGHAGTLDPLATGLLIVAIGRDATRQIDKFVKLDKVYYAKAKLGEISDSYDADGKIIVKENTEILTRETIASSLLKFTGQIEQVPPMFSAKKIAGKKLYELARQGKEVARSPVKVNIKRCDLVKYEWPWLEIEAEVSSGTYIRSLVHDLGQELSTGAVVYELRRLRIGNYSINQANDLTNIASENWQDFLLTVE